MFNIVLHILKGYPSRIALFSRPICSHDFCRIVQFQCTQFKTCLCFIRMYFFLLIPSFSNKFTIPPLPVYIWKKSNWCRRAFDFNSKSRILIFKINFCKKSAIHKNCRLLFYQPFYFTKLTDCEKTFFIVFFYRHCLQQPGAVTIARPVFGLSHRQQVHPTPPAGELF